MEAQVKTFAILSLLLALFTMLTFGFAITAVPISGPFCLERCINYPYLDIAGQFPKDFYWMMNALFLNLFYIYWAVKAYRIVSWQFPDTALFGIILAASGSVILLMDYVVQLSVVPISAIKGEMDGVAVISQYNDHGLFIALEELGITLQVISFACLNPFYSLECKAITKKVIHFSLPVMMVIVSIVGFLWMSALHGLDRSYRYEVLVISVLWLGWLLGGIWYFISFIRKGVAFLPAREVF